MNKLYSDRTISIARLNAKIYSQREMLINYQNLLKEGKQENAKLKELLEECKSSVLFETDVIKETSGKHSKDYKMLTNLLIKITHAIGEK